MKRSQHECVRVNGVWRDANEVRKAAQWRARCEAVALIALLNIAIVMIVSLALLANEVQP